MEKLAVGASPILVDHRGLKINEDGPEMAIDAPTVLYIKNSPIPGNMFAGTGLGEESGEGIILRLGSVHCRQSSIGLQERFVDSLFHFISRNFHLKTMLHTV